MKDLPDVAAKLFTNEYRAVKLKGKKAKKNAPGTGSVSLPLLLCPCSLYSENMPYSCLDAKWLVCYQCFDTTDPKEVTRAFLETTRKNLDTGTFGTSSLRPKSDDPVWDGATLSYRQAYPLFCCQHDSS